MNKYAVRMALANNREAVDLRSKKGGFYGVPCGEKTTGSLV